MGSHGGIDAAETRAGITRQTFEHLNVSAAVRESKVPSDTPVPPAPEHWEIYQQIRASSHLWWDGGLADQPYWLTLELDAIEAGQQQYQALVRASAVAVEALKPAP